VQPAVDDAGARLDSMLQQIGDGGWEASGTLQIEVDGRAQVVVLFKRPRDVAVKAPRNVSAGDAWLAKAPVRPDES